MEVTTCGSELDEDAGRFSLFGVLVLRARRIMAWKDVRLEEKTPAGTFVVTS